MKEKGVQNLYSSDFCSIALCQFSVVAVKKSEGDQFFLLFGVSDWMEGKEKKVKCLRNYVFLATI